MQKRCNFPDISYLSETQKNDFQFLIRLQEFVLLACPTADPGVTSLIPARSHTFFEIDREIISMVILLSPLFQEGLLSVTSKSICVCARSTG